MAKGPARYEFRLWSDSLRGIKHRFEEECRLSQPREGSDIYILSRCTDETNVKIRNGTIETKILVERRGRLEQWQPDLRVVFPLEPTLITNRIFPDLRLEPPVLHRNGYSPDEFLTELVKPRSEVRAVEVQKRRIHGQVGACIVEFADVRIADRRLHSAALESRDPAALEDLIDHFELGQFKNWNYVRNLKLLIGI